ncbi:DUF434 domain-containing protein [Dysgonomonas sp. 521]|uniref:DUF434 domain-containing protein n=1 Tax=Dysgonomonas sp. 521 TaxID=2302932 RepID=UPI0013D80B14|nr:DUF434 domain-containing protein [Dysgonomonas sp. 521]NDV97092.1 DUF434 domain-containing protein [Dysgonomonas sp. 521]
MPLPRGTDKLDTLLFITEKDKLVNTMADTLFLLRRGYPFESALRFTSSHYQCVARQILMLKRGICTDESLKIKKQKELSFNELEGKTLYIDGFNLIITLEVLLSAGTVFKGRDGCIRDLAGLRGNYSIISETISAVDVIAGFCNASGVSSLLVYLDSPVSNSGKLKNLILEHRAKFNMPVSVELIHNPDVNLYDKSVVVSSDSIILEHCTHWFNLAACVMDKQHAEAIIDLSADN